MALRLTGMYSNMDTDTIISQLMKAQRTKIDVVEKKKTKLEWKVDAWKSLNTKIYALFTGTLDDMRSSSFYSTKAATISNSSVATVTASTSAVNGTQELSVKSLAKSGYLTGGVLSTSNSSTLSASSTLSDLGYTGGSGSIEVKVGTKDSVTVSIDGSTTISSVISKLKEAGVNASFDATNKRIFVSSTASGADSNFSLSAGDSNGLAALNSLGLNVATSATTQEYAKWKSYQGYSYVAGYTGADATQIAYNKEYESAYNATKSSLETGKVTAQTNLDAILKKYNPDYNSDNRESAYNALTADKDSLTSQKTDLEAEVSDYNSKIVEAKAVLNDENSTVDEKLEAENKLREAEEKLAEAKKQLTDTTTKLTDIENATSIHDSIADIDSALVESTLSSNVQNVLQAKAIAAGEALAGGSSAGAVKVEGQDAEITLNGATFTSSTNAFNINGLTIVAKEVTGNSTVSIGTSLDYDGVYKKIKDFFTEYNKLIKEMDSLYNADSAKGYEPLTDEEKEAMTDSQIEKWETKIKDAILRRDNTLSDVTSAMKNAMAKTFTINGSKMNLATFGISTGSYFTTDSKSRGVYHIDGDSEDSTSSGNADKLKAALATDPDSVAAFFTELSKNLYNTLNGKMKSIEGIRSVYNVYEDKKMASDIKDYEEKMELLEKKFKAMEDKYYKQFSAMETALAKLQSSTSSLTSLLGSN